MTVQAKDAAHPTWAEILAYVGVTQAEAYRYMRLGRIAMEDRQRAPSTLGVLDPVRTLLKLDRRFEKAARPIISPSRGADAAAIRKVRASALRWRRRHPFAKVPLPDVVIAFVLEWDGHRCRYCGDHFDLTVDHVIAEAIGGPSVLENLVACCRPCNSKKGTKTLAPPDWVGCDGFEVEP